MEFPSITVNDYLSLSAVLLAVLIGEATRQTTRVLTAALIMAVLTQSPTAVLMLSIMWLIVPVFGLVRRMM